MRLRPTIVRLHACQLQWQFHLYLDGAVTAPQPEIAVTYVDPYNGYPTEVYDDYGSMDFGSTIVDARVQRTFTISNSGAGTLALGTKMRPT